MVSRDAGFQRDSKIRLYGFDRRMRPAQAHFFLDGVVSKNSIALKAE